MTTGTGRNIPIADCGFSKRVLTRLPSDITSSEELWRVVAHDGLELMRIPGFGAKSWNEVAETLEGLGFPKPTHSYREYVVLKAFPKKRRGKAQRRAARRVLIEEMERKLEQATSDFELAEARGMLSIALSAEPYENGPLQRRWQKGRHTAQERFALIMDAAPELER